MDPKLLHSIGLSHPQAAAYVVLLEHGEVKPSEAAALLKTTRTNAYKVLDKLVKLQLAEKVEQQKKFIYRPTNPLALTAITAKYRAEAAAREEAAQQAIKPLLKQFYKLSDKPTVEVVSGVESVIHAYHKQLKLREDVLFIRTTADVASLGFEAMHNIRITPARFGNQRKGLMGAPEQGPVNYESHKRTNLDITWYDKELYNAPVEWSVTDSSLLIALFGNEPHAILIIDPLVAAAFRQIWNIMSMFFVERPAHKRLAPKD